MTKIIDKFSSVFAKESFLSASVAVTLTFYVINLVAKLLCRLYSLFIVDFIFALCILEATSWHIGLTALVMMIAAYESRFNAYKLKREAAAENAD